MAPQSPRWCARLSTRPAPDVQFRNLWGRAKLDLLTDTAEAEPASLYDTIAPVLPLGLPFAQVAVSPDWFEWPALPDLLPTSFPGVTTSRDAFLVDADLDRLEGRVDEYFDPDLGDEEVARRFPAVMKTTQRFDAPTVRRELVKRGRTADSPSDRLQSGIVRYAYRPFDSRWLYWERDTKLLDEKRADYRPHVFEGNMWLCAAQHLRKGAELPQSYFARHIASYHLIERGALWFPAWLREDTPQHRHVLARGAPICRRPPAATSKALL